MIKHALKPRYRKAMELKNNEFVQDGSKIH